MHRPVLGFLAKPRSQTHANMPCVFVQISFVPGQLVTSLAEQESCVLVVASFSTGKTVVKLSLFCKITGREGLGGVILVGAGMHFALPGGRMLPI